MARSSIHDGNATSEPARASSEPARAGRSQTIAWAPWIYGEDGVPLDDPAECFHEASKLHPHVVDFRVQGGYLLERRPELRASACRAVKRRPHLPSAVLPPPALPESSFRAAVERRESGRDFGAGPLTLTELATLLYAAYGVTRAAASERPPMRTVPSGGALYPLEIYPAVVNVAGLEEGLYHFDPLRGVLERLRQADLRAEMAPLTVYPELFVKAAVVLFVTALFWRTRFKYGLRGYRFALIEAGHLGQNVLLTATALGLASVAVGGFYDREVDGFLGADGVNESALYALSTGRRHDPEG
jgi:SagB-type dehydrogenase family enzyme